MADSKLVFSLIISLLLHINGYNQTPLPDETVESNQAHSHFGNSISNAGDLNGDGYDEIIIGAYDYDNGQSNEGRVYVYNGSALGIITIPVSTMESDQNDAKFGTSVSSAGDVNGDGYDDLIVGAESFSNGELNEGRVYIYLGSPTGINIIPSVTLESDQVDAFFGNSVSGIGDVNGDGFDDVIVGSVRYTNGQIDEGASFIYYGSITGINTIPSVAIEGNQEGAYFGYSVSTAGDVNGDGFDDIIIGSSQYSNGQLNEGRTFIYHGSETGIITAPATILEINQISAFFGCSVSGGGDLNNDGYDDILVGANQYDNGETSEGGVFIFMGSATGIISTPVITLEGNQIGANFGYSLSCVGDVNGDGYGDIFIGSDQFDNGQGNEGRAFLYFGSMAGISPDIENTMESDQSFANFGRSVSGADVNGDGYADLIVGAYSFTNVETDEGKAYIYMSNYCVLTNYYADDDNDGFGNLDVTIEACSEPFGYVNNFLDCNDLNYDINPLASELCNSLDDNCNGLIDDAITETISISAGGPITFCQGGNVLLTATYSGATVQWKKNGVNIPGATSPTYLVTTKATYTCVTTSPCGTATSTGIFVNVNKNPAASITAGGATTFCAGGSVVLTANGGGGLSYQWYKGASLIAGATSINYTATIAGNYKCRVTKTATGCFKNSNVISVSVPCKEGEMVDGENTFNIYPNPNDGTFTIEAVVKTQDFASQELSTIEIFNNIGQLIFSKEINAHDGIVNELIEIKNVVPGIYLVKLSNNGMLDIKNILVE